MATCRFLGKMLCSRPFFLFVLMFIALSPSRGLSYELLIGTGGADSFSYFAGKAVCRTISRYDSDLSCRPVPTEDYADTLTNVQDGSLDMALVSSKMIYDALHGAGYFQYITLEYDQLRLLLPLYRMPISLVVRRDAGISSISDLIGKRVNGGAPFSLHNLVFKEIMAAEGWQKSSFSLFQHLPAVNAQDFMALHRGSVQAMLHIGMHPDEQLRRSILGGSATIVGIEGQAVSRLIDSKSGYCSYPIAAGAYPGQSGDIDTLSMETLLITSADTDSETVTLILDALSKAKRHLQYVHPSFLQGKINVETLNDSYLHPHPAAILFFQVYQDRL